MRLLSIYSGTLRRTSSSFSGLLLCDYTCSLRATDRPVLGPLFFDSFLPVFPPFAF
jgi:hypothetical protein